MAVTTGIKSAKVSINPQNQNMETVNLLVASIIGKSVCRACGRLIKLDFEFAGDPEPDAAKTGVISVETEAF
jgi:hypothetical protein